MTRKPSDRSLTVQGTNDVPVPPEIRGYYEGKGISLKFLKEHYGLGKSLHIRPTKEQLRARMIDRT